MQVLINKDNVPLTFDGRFIYQGGTPTILSDDETIDSISDKLRVNGSLYMASKLFDRGEKFHLKTAKV